VAQLRLVNLAVGSLSRGEWPEGIFQHEGAGGSILNPAAAPDNTGLTSLLAIRQANILQFCLFHNTDDHPHSHNHGSGGCDCEANVAAVAAAKQQFMTGLDQLLLNYANSAAGRDGFSWNGTSLEPENGAAIAANRLVLLMNNTQGFGNSPNPYTAENRWHDTQIWEMGSVQGGSPLTAFQIPFDAQLGSTTAGAPGALSSYQVMRSTFFAPATQTDVISKANGFRF